MEEALLGGLSPQRFLRRHWQKRPLLVRGALPDFRGVLGKRALFALAARDDVESRLVERRGKQWKVAHGPLPLQRLRNAKGAWTLLVNGVNCYNAAAESLLRRFSFVPQARLDDLMVSYAAPGGGVGPHFDSYDVFLIQGAGRRIWRLARKKAFACEAQTPLRLIRDFMPDEEYLLEPGDLLYLPPGWGHEGVALDACMTCSVGFRAPRGAELAAAFLDHLHERGLPDAAYRDPGLRPARHPGRIGADLVAFSAKVVSRIAWNRSDIEEFAGRYLSTPKPNIVFSPSTRNAFSIKKKTIQLHPKTQLLYQGSRFFINGEVLRPRPAQRRALALLADRRRAPGRMLARAGLADLICEWHRSGFLSLKTKNE
jgi:50S ribosomal protein L16 3-hydroxylase